MQSVKVIGIDKPKPESQRVWVKVIKPEPEPEPQRVRVKVIKSKLEPRRVLVEVKPQSEE
jgi:hypothetical protein